MRTSKTLHRLALLICLSGLMSGSVFAETTEDFYAGKTIHLLAGYPAGSGYDFAARVLAKYMGRHIAGNPRIIVENMVGAASLRMTNYLYAKAPRDGTYIGSVGHEILLAPLLRPGQAQFDPLKFNWLGSMNRTVTLGITWGYAGITSFDDLYKHQIIVGTSETGSDSYIASSMVNRLLHTKLKIVSGYPGSNDVFIAGERGEIQGYFGLSLATLLTTQYNLLANKKINILVQLALEKDPTLPNVPLVSEFAKDAETRKAIEIILAPYKAARPYAAPPDVPADRVTQLSTAFDQTMKDPDFLKAAETAKLEVSPMTGSQIVNLLKQVYEAPSGAIAAARAVISP
jgi:tripartite-type tricarboxylate transporter receptor subunit TctC